MSDYIDAISIIDVLINKITVFYDGREFFSACDINSELFKGLSIIADLMSDLEEKQKNKISEILKTEEHDMLLNKFYRHNIHCHPCEEKSPTEVGIIIALLIKRIKYMQKNTSIEIIDIGNIEIEKLDIKFMYLN